MYEYADNYTCSVKFSVPMNRDGNICQEGETVAGQKIFTFSGFTSTITAAETVNDADDTSEDKALHNGVSGLVWLFTGRDDNFDPLSVKKITTAEMDYE